MKNKKLNQKYRGVIPPVLTPFYEDLAIDFETLKKFINWLCQQKVTALFSMGGSGEYQTLTIDERKKIIDCVVEVNGKRRLFFAGTGGKNLQETIELCEYAQSRGADGVGVVIPEFIPPGDASIFDYFHAVDRAITIPIMVYDPRGEGDHTATPALMRRMIDELQHIVGIKYRTTNSEYMGSMAYEIAADISLLSGNELTYLQDLSIGAVGCIGGGGNFYPELMWKLQDYFEQCEILKARQLQYQIIEAVNVLNRVYWPLSGKIVLQELGIPFQPVTRVKGSPFREEDVQAIRTYYRQLLKINSKFTANE